MYTTQLFGDTVNMANRMESTGIPSLIQVYQDTPPMLLLLVAKAPGGHLVKTELWRKGRAKCKPFFVGWEHQSQGLLMQAHPI